MKLEEDSRLRDINVQMDIGEAMGAQQRAADAQAASTAAKQQGIQEAISLGEQAVSFIPLYAQQKGMQKGAARQAGLFDPEDQSFRKFKKENEYFRSNPEYLKAYKELYQPFDVAGQPSIAAPATQDKKYDDYTTEELQKMLVTNPALFDKLAKDRFKNN